MKIIGITGKSGSGKSTLTAELVKELKCQSVNIDKIGHKATSNEIISEQLYKVFGKQILGKEGKIDRKKLGNIVFSDKEKMNILTDITWDYMQKELDEILEKEKKSGAKNIVLEWALLPISKYWKACDIKICMQAEEEQRKSKVIERDGISEEYFEKRESGGLNYQIYKFDFIFQNDYKIETIQKIVRQWGQS